MKYLLEKGLLDGDCLTVTGKTLAENLADLPGLKPGQDDHPPAREPDQGDRPHPDPARQPRARGRGGQDHRQGRAALHRPGQGLRLAKKTCSHALEQKEIDKGDVVIIRYEGPKGGPGMPEMLTPTSAIMGAGLGKDVALITDGRFSRRLARLHRRPRHARGAGGRPDRAGAKRRQDHDRRRQEPHRRGRHRRRTGQAPRQLESTRPTRPPAARSTSTSRT